MEKSKLNALVFLVFCALAGFLLTSKSAGQAAGDNYYYSGGRKIQIVLDTSRVAVLFKKDVSQDSVYSILPKFQQFSAVERVEKQDFARANIYLVPLTRSLTRTNLEALHSGLQSSSMVKTVGRVYSLEAKPESNLILTEEFVVKFKPEITRQQIEQFNADNNVEIVRASEYAKNQFTLQAKTGSNKDALTMANQYYESELTAFAHPNFITTVERRAAPNDLYYPDQWHLNNTGQEGGQPDADIDALEAWNITTGDPNIKIAILDDSIEKGHEDLQASIVASKDFTDDDDDPSPGTGDYHGTAVAGIAAAIGNNNKGVTGVCYTSKIIAIRWGTTYEDFVNAFYWAANTANADIISNSWGFTTPAPDNVVDAINDVAANGRGGKGCVVLFAAGNSNNDISDTSAGELAALSSVIAVGASTNKDFRACYSSWGNDLDVMAPSNTWIGGVCPTPKPADAVGTWTTDQSIGGFNNGTNGPDAAGLYTKDFGGTSSACPTAAGVVGLLLSVNSDLTRDEVQDILEATAEKIAPGDAGYDANGFSDHYGYGRINAHRSIVPTVNISIEPHEVEPGESFTVKVTGSAPFGLKSIWWFGDDTGIVDIDQAHWQDVTGGKKVFTREWNASIDEKGTYRLGANARDVLYPVGSNGSDSADYPHQASEGSGIAYAEIKVVPTFTEWAMIVSGLLFIFAFVYRQKCVRVAGFHQ